MENTNFFKSWTCFIISYLAGLICMSCIMNTLLWTSDIPLTIYRYNITFWAFPLINYYGQTSTVFHSFQQWEVPGASSTSGSAALGYTTKYRNTFNPTH